MSNGTTTTEIPVIKHWIVTAFTPGVLPDLSDSIGGATATVASAGTIGSTMAGSTQITALYPDSASAMNAARTLAQLTPGTYYVVYEAMWWAHTDPVPVHLLPVIQAVAS